MNDPVTIWIGAIVTLAVLSYLVRDNPAYRLVQAAALGAAVGYTLVIAWVQVLYPRWAQPIWNAGMGHAIDAATGRPDRTGLLWLLALIPGSLWYFQLSKKWFWLSTIISGLFVGVAAGLAFKSQMLLIMPQMAASIRPLNPFAGPNGMTWDSFWTCLDNLLFLVLLFSALLYFFFSLKPTNPLMGRPLRLGRIAIMICLGSMFGGTVMTRVAYLLDRLMMLHDDWLVGQILTPLKALFRTSGA